MLERRTTDDLALHEGEAKGQKAVLLYIGHSLFRNLLRSLLETATSHAVISVETAPGRLEQSMERHTPDLVLADAVGGSDLKCMLQSAPGSPGARARLLILCPPGVEVASPRALVVRTSCEVWELLRAIEEVLATHPSSSRVEAAMSARTSIPHVTAREREILELVADGLSSKQIARVLGISVATVRTHRQRAMSRLDLRNAAHVARFVRTHLQPS